MDWYGLATALTAGAAVISATTALFTVRFQARAQAMQRARERAWSRLDSVLDEIQRLRTVDYDITSPLFDNKEKAQLLMEELRRTEALDNAILHLEIACRPYDLSIAEFRGKIKSLRNIAKKMKDREFASGLAKNVQVAQFSAEREQYQKAYQQFQDDTASLSKKIAEMIR